jgi:F-type H+-transporting ATPase subunit delta
MAEKNTIARPYAQAAFEIARADGKLARWSETLTTLAQAVADPNMKALIDNPSIDAEVVNGVLFDLCARVLDDKSRSFVRVLNENDRLEFLPEVAQLFEEYRAEAEKTIEAEVATAFPLSEAQQRAITDALKKRLGRDVSLTTRVDESIVGGAVVRAGDLVIDASVTGQLQKLAADMMR